MPVDVLVRYGDGFGPAVMAPACCQPAGVSMAAGYQ